MNGKQMAADVLAAIKGHVGGVVEMLRAEVAEQIKAVPVVPGPAGKDGADGAPPDFESVKLAVAAVAPPIIEKHFELEKAVFVERADTYLKGLTVPRGEKGEAGSDGRDALDIEPITNLEKSRTYSRGTWATYKGSLIRAMRTTDAIKEGDPAECGWAVMVEGSSPPTIEYDGRRGFTVKSIKGGKEICEPFTIPCVLDAGFFKEGQTYETGDGVTYGGSYWIAQKATGAKPEVGKEDWRLAVRKGRDGKRD